MTDELVRTQPLIVLFTVQGEYPCCKRKCWLDVHNSYRETYVKTCRHCKIEWHVVRRLTHIEGSTRDDAFDWYESK